MHAARSLSFVNGTSKSGDSAIERRTLGHETANRRGDLPLALTLDEAGSLL